MEQIYNKNSDSEFKHKQKFPIKSERARMN